MMGIDSTVEKIENQPGQARKTEDIRTMYFGGR